MPGPGGLYMPHKELDTWSFNEGTPLHILVWELKPSLWTCAWWNWWFDVCSPLLSLCSDTPMCHHSIVLWGLFWMHVALNWEVSLWSLENLMCILAKYGLVKGRFHSGTTCNFLIKPSHPNFISLKLVFYTNVFIVVWIHKCLSHTWYVCLRSNSNLIYLPSLCPQVVGAVLLLTVKLLKIISSKWKLN